MHHREVAIKFTYKEKIPTFSWIKDPSIGPVPKEYYVLRRLRHTNIIQIIEHYENDRYFILVTELHGTPWTQTNPILASKVLHPTLRRNGVREDGGSKANEASLLSSLSEEGRKQVKQRTSCDLFECIGMLSLYDGGD